RAAPPGPVLTAPVESTARAAVPLPLRPAPTGPVLTAPVEGTVRAAVPLPLRPAPTGPVLTTPVERTAHATVPLPLRPAPTIVIEEAPPRAQPPLVSVEGYARFEARAKRRRVDRRIEAARSAMERKRLH